MSTFVVGFGSSRGSISSPPFILTRKGMAAVKRSFLLQEAANSSLASVKDFVILVGHPGSGRHRLCRSNGFMGVQCGSCLISSTESSTESDCVQHKFRKSLRFNDAGVVELVDTRDLKKRRERFHRLSNPVITTR